MKRIEAIINVFKLDEVVTALDAIGVQGITAFECKGFGRQKGHSAIYRGAEYKFDFVPKHYFFVIVPDDLAEKVVEIIGNTARTGKIGDGIIIISDVSELIRIRNGERMY